MGNYEIVKTKTIVYKIQQIAMDCLTFDESYRKIRGDMRNKMFDCYQCNRRFEDGGKISLIITDKGNKVVCHNCGVKIKEELEQCVRKQ